VKKEDHKENKAKAAIAVEKGGYHTRSFLVGTATVIGKVMNDRTLLLVVLITSIRELLRGPIC